MSATATLVRLGVFAVLTAGLLQAALGFVPGADPNLEARSFVFVFGAPWLAALLVVRPMRLLRALAATFTGCGGEGLTTARTLDLVAGLTMAVGTLGMFASFLSFRQTATEHLGSVGADQVFPGVVIAMAVPLLFALIARFVLYEPLLVAIRRRHTPEGEVPEGRPRVHTAWKVILVAFLAGLAVEGFRAAFLGPAETAPRDTSFVVVGTDPTTGKQSPALRPDAPTMGKPIRVELVGPAGEVICRVDGETLTALPGDTDELFGRLRALATGGADRRVEIEAGPKVAFGHLVAAVDAAIRATKRREAYSTADYEDEEEVGGWQEPPAPKPRPIYQRVRVLVPTAEAPVVPLELRFIHEHHEHDRLVQLSLPYIEGVETVTVDGEGAPLRINVLWDFETERSEVYVGRRAMGHSATDRDELRARIRERADARRDPTTGASEVELVLRCDRNAQVGAVYRILELLASKPCRVQQVLISGRAHWRRPR